MQARQLQGWDNNGETMAINAAKWKALSASDKTLWREREAAQMGQLASETEYRANTYWQINQAKAERLAEGRTAFEAGQTTEETERSEAINIASKEASQQRAEEFRAADEERKMRENVQVTPLNTPEEPRREGELTVGETTTRASTPEEIALHQKIIAGTAARRDYEAAGVGFPESKAIDRVVPGETDFQRERRISDEQARQRTLENREVDRKFFEQIAINKREEELKQREEDYRNGK